MGVELSFAGDSCSGDMVGRLGTVIWGNLQDSDEGDGSGIKCCRTALKTIWGGGLVAEQ